MDKTTVALVNAAVSAIEKKLKAVEAKVNTQPPINGRDGKDGRNGIDGRSGVDGRNGRDGKDGVDGVDGVDGNQIVNAQVDFDGHLTLYMSDGNEIDAGDLTTVWERSDRLVQIIRSAGGGVSDELRDQIQSNTDRIEAIENSDVGGGNGGELGQRVTDLEANDTTQDGRLEALEANDAIQDTDIDNLQANDTVQDNRLDALETKDADQDTDISELQARADETDTEQAEQNARLDAIENSKPIIASVSVVNSVDASNIVLNLFGLTGGLIDFLGIRNRVLYDFSPDRASDVRVQALLTGINLNLLEVNDRIKLQYFVPDGTQTLGIDNGEFVDLAIADLDQVFVLSVNTLLGDTVLVKSPWTPIPNELRAPLANNPDTDVILRVVSERTEVGVGVVDVAASIGRVSFEVR